MITESLLESFASRKKNRIEDQSDTEDDTTKSNWHKGELRPNQTCSMDSVCAMLSLSIVVYVSYKYSQLTSIIMMSLKSICLNSLFN